MARAVVVASGHEVNKVVNKNGKHNLDRQIPNYNLAAKRSTWVVFRDSDTHCPVQLKHSLTERITEWSPRFALRIVHPMSEAWLLADPDSFATYFHLKPGQIPADPESLAHPKLTLLNLCKSSNSQEIRYGMIGRNDRPGPLYSHMINDYAIQAWKPVKASERSESLQRAMSRLRALPS